MIGFSSQEDLIVWELFLTSFQIGAEDGAVLEIAEDFNVYAMDLTLA